MRCPNKALETYHTCIVWGQDNHYCKFEGNHFKDNPEQNCVCGCGYTIVHRDLPK